MNLHFFQDSFFAMEFVNKMESIVTSFNMFNQCYMIMALNFLSKFKFNFDCTEGIFYKIKINVSGIYIVKKKVWLEGCFQI